MILNNNDLQQIRQILERQSGLDAELLARCSDLLHLGKYDQAVHSAFILLEERLRHIVHKDGLTGVVMVQNVFGQKGTLTHVLALSDWEREQYKNLYEAAFRLFRNPSAHTVTNYDASTGKAIMGLVNLLLLLLGDPTQWPPSTTFPESIEKAISLTEQMVNLAAAQRLRLFLSHCYQNGLEPRSSKSTYWIPFKRETLQRMEQWDEARFHPLTLFYLYADEKKPGLYVPINQYYTRVVGLDIEPLGNTLKQVGFYTHGKYRDYQASFVEQNSQVFFEDFLAWLKNVVAHLTLLERRS
ncbi:MAG: TIGR02391 family protein [Anaerolineae bacterium]|nr:TIGR02391 family protein [Anaerolineae bacterium]